MGKEGLRMHLLDACPSIDFSSVYGFPNDCYDHTKLFNVASKFFGNDGESITHHIASFFKLVVDFNVVHEDDLMVIFSFSLKGDAENWFYDLPEKYIVPMVDFFECFLLRCYEGEVGEINKLVKEYDSLLPRTHPDVKEEIHDDPFEEAHKDLLIEDIIENPPHDAIEDLECAQVSVSDDDNAYTPDLP